MERSNADNATLQDKAWEKAYRAANVLVCEIYDGPTRVATEGFGDGFGSVPSITAASVKCVCLEFDCSFSSSLIVGAVLTQMH